MRETKAERVLCYIGMHPQGLTFSSIQKFICEMNGKNWDEKAFEYDPKTKARTRPVRRYRGYWCDYLTGPGGHYSGSKGLLHRFCIQHPVSKRWILTEQIKGPFAGNDMPHTKTQKYNRALAMGYQSIYLDSLPVCPNCGQKVHPYSGEPGKEFSSDKRAHIVSWSAGGAIQDCLGRIWCKDGLTTVIPKEFEEMRNLMTKKLGWEHGTNATEIWLCRQVRN